MQVQHYSSHSSLKDADPTLNQTESNQEPSLKAAQNHQIEHNQFFWRKNSLIDGQETMIKDPRKIDEVSEVNFLVEHKQVVRGIFRNLGMGKQNNGKQEEKPGSQGEMLEKWWNEYLKEKCIFGENYEIFKQKVGKNVNIPRIFYQLLEEVPENFQESYSQLFYKVATTRNQNQYFLLESKQKIQADIQNNMNHFLQVLAHHNQLNVEEEKIQKIVYELCLTIAYCLEGFFENSLLKEYSPLLEEEGSKRSRLEKECKKKYKVVRRRNPEGSSSDVLKRRKN